MAAELAQCLQWRFRGCNVTGKIVVYTLAGRHRSARIPHSAFRNPQSGTDLRLVMRFGRGSQVLARQVRRLSTSAYNLRVLAAAVLRPFPVSSPRHRLSAAAGGRIPVGGIRRRYRAAGRRWPQGIGRGAARQVARGVETDVSCRRQGRMPLATRRWRACAAGPGCEMARKERWSPVRPLLFALFFCNGPRGWKQKSVGVAVPRSSMTARALCILAAG